MGDKEGDLSSKVGNLETKVGILENSIGNIEKGIDSHSQDMVRLFQGQEDTKLTVVNSINSLTQSLPCVERKFKIEQLEKNGNGLNGRVQKLEEKAGNTEGDQQYKKGWAKALDWGLKLLISLTLLFIAIMTFKNNFYPSAKP